MLINFAKYFAGLKQVMFIFCLSWANGTHIFSLFQSLWRLGLSVTFHRHKPIRHYFPYQLNSENFNSQNLADTSDFDSERKKLNYKLTEKKKFQDIQFLLF